MESLKAGIEKEEEKNSLYEEENSRLHEIIRMQGLPRFLTTGNGGIRLLDIPRR